MKTKAHAFIFARGGSKGVPRKNIRLLAGLPLISHSINIARQCPSIDRIIVSTDDAEIAEISRQAGAEIPFSRPAELASDHAPEWLAWQQAVTYIYGNEPTAHAPLFVSLPATSPFRSVEDVEGCLSLLVDGSFDAVVTVTPSRRSPYFNMVTRDERGSSQILLDNPKGGANRRQDVPPLYDMTTVAYAATPAYILRAQRLFEGSVGSVLVPENRAWDIDTEFDFKIAEAIASSRNI